MTRINARLSRYTPLAALLAALAAGLLPGAAGAQQPAAPRTVRVASSGAVAPVRAAAADTAIDQLEDFLERYPDSPLRPNALFQLGELLVRRADEAFAAQQRAQGSGDATPDSPAAARPGTAGAPPAGTTGAGAGGVTGTTAGAAGTTAARGGDVAQRPEYGPAITRYEELVRRYPTFEKIDAAAYTLGTLYAFNQRWADAARMFEMVAGRDSSRFQGEALFRLGDSYFELAARERGDARRATFARAATAYERATQRAPQQGDIYFLSLYKLGWAYYNQATQTNTAPYNRAVETFGTLVTSYDKLSAEQQARLGLKQEAIEYMAVAFTQVGGAEAANRFFAQEGRGQYRQAVLTRVAESLREQGDFTRAVEAYEQLIEVAPNDSAALRAQREIIDIYQNRMLEAERAQTARLALVERFGPGSAWVQANPGLAAQATTAREEALRQSGQYLLARAQTSRDRAAFQQASQLYERYLNEFQSSDSAQAVAAYYGESLFGQGEYMRAGAAYSRAAFGYANRPAAAATDTAARDTTARRTGAAAPANLAETAGRNAIVAFDSALAKNKSDRAAQDSLFTVVERFAQAFPQSGAAKNALILKGRRASETQRWDEMAEAFRTYATTYPNDAYTPTAQKLVGDALYRGGSYAEAQVQWEQAQQVARASGKSALADSISNTRNTAADLFADTLIRQGQYRRAAEEVYVAYADKNPQNAKAPDALRNAIETYMIVVDSAQKRGTGQDEVTAARNRAIELSARLVQQYPNYRYRLQYQNLNARLLAQSGRREEAVEALRGLATNTQLPARERLAAQAQLAIALDSLGKDREAAQEYERLSQLASGADAANAQWNAALAYKEANDNAAAAAAFQRFATRFPKDQRVNEARAQRYDLLITAGDTAAARTELARVCRNPASDEQRERCTAERARTMAGAARESYERGRELYTEYDAIELVIRTKAALTQRGVQQASARKQQLLRQITSTLREAIESGNAEYVAAATYLAGMAQWEYGRFFENVKLPEGLTDEERTAAQNGAKEQAQQYYEGARQTWNALIEKANADEALRNDERARRWVDRAREAARGDVPETPPTSRRLPAGEVTYGRKP